MVKKVAEKFGRLDVLVNNAGITRDKSIRKMTDEDWLEVIQTNLNAVFFCTSAAIPIMTEQNFGRIVNIGSMNGQTAAFGQANYGASKGGVMAFTKTAALELAKFNITVNVVNPGYTLTDMFDKVPEDRLTDDDRRLKNELANLPEVTILHIIYQQKAYEGHAKDHEFSGTSMREHWQSGYEDTKRTLLHRYWLEMPAQGAGCVVHDVHRETD